MNKRFRAEHSREDGARLEWQVKGTPTTLALDDNEVAKLLAVTGITLPTETKTQTLTASNDGGG